MDERAFTTVRKGKMVVEDEVDDAEQHHGQHQSRARTVQSTFPARQCAACSHYGHDSLQIPVAVGTVPTMPEPPPQRSTNRRPERRFPCDTCSQGSRFSNALPLSGSIGTETWSCTTSQLPSIFRKHAVHRSRKSVLLPFFNVPLTRLRLCPNATSSPKVSVRSRIS